ncbi:flagellar motor switch protein FliG [Acidiferrimicrobium sp. IK]|uniref:flagellar motor switch protein FliG n=1 Tax=Acidiferrimicrobium sp. IK TaxID=2871700 RepID=UPI0021CB986F|nr:flagellar motor switch protein FliG [Acidiferrimicrobium sp. IK]MCU4185029.1 flagellar motor switch protein FliG [Acidiferrimicrobium sp. IK]
MTAAITGGPTATLTGTQKAAVVLSQADPTRALRILKAMSEQESVRVLSAMATLPPLSPEQVSRVVNEYHEMSRSQSGVGLVKRLLVDRLGSARAGEVLAQFGAPANPGPLHFLHRIDPLQILTFIGEEHPQTIAVVLAHLPAEQAAAVLKAMDDTRRADVARRIATMGRVHREAIDHIARTLDQQLSALVRSGGAATAELGGVSSMVAILNQTDRSSEKQLLADLEAADPELAEEIRNELFVFDDITTLDDRTLQLVLRNVVPKDLAVALKNAPAELLATFTRNMSERAAQDLRDEIEVMRPTRLSQVEAAQSAVVRIVRELEASGEIVIARGDDDLV